MPLHIAPLCVAQCGRCGRRLDCRRGHAAASYHAAYHCGGHAFICGSPAFSCGSLALACSSIAFPCGRFAFNCCRLAYKCSILAHALLSAFKSAWALRRCLNIPDPVAFVCGIRVSIQTLLSGTLSTDMWYICSSMFFHSGTAGIGLGLHEATKLIGDL